jgi:glutamate/tyrosine decarboxylase-like PLP-dependent enzyme
MDRQAKELTLDPENWDQLRALGHKMLDDMMDHLKQVRQRPIIQMVGDDAKALLSQPPPMEGMGPEAAYRDFQIFLKSQSNFNKDPRFWGFVVGTGSPSGLLSDMLSSGLNVNMVGGPLASTMLEMQVMAWLKGMLGYPMDSSGIIVSGGTMASLLGLTVARNSMSGDLAREKGLQSIHEKMTLYGSEEMHVCIQKSAEMLGLGNESLRRIPVNEQYKIKLDELKKAIERDRMDGNKPFCVVANAGTVNIGSFDDINALADLCAREKLWLHVDGAFGAWAALAPKTKGLIKGLERADSVAFDLHKWIYMPYDVGCVFFRRELDQLKSFSHRPDYYGMSKDTPPQFADYGLELSRSFRALKIWMGIKENGVAKYGALIQQNVDQAQHLAELIKAHKDLELMAPVPFNTVCFRYRGNVPEEGLEQLNKGLMRQLMFVGAGSVSETKIHGKFALRACFTNHRTTIRDIEEYVEALVKHGKMIELGKTDPQSRPS